MQNSLGMVHKSNIIHVLQSTDVRNWANSTHAVICMMACLCKLGKVNRFASILAKDSTHRTNLLTFQHKCTCSILASVKVCKQIVLQNRACVGALKHWHYPHLCGFLVLNNGFLLFIHILNKTRPWWKKIRVCHYMLLTVEEPNVSCSCKEWTVVVLQRYQITLQWCLRCLLILSLLCNMVRDDSLSWAPTTRNHILCMLIILKADILVSCLLTRKLFQFQEKILSHSLLGAQTLDNFLLKFHWHFQMYLLTHM